MQIEGKALCALLGAEPCGLDQLPSIVGVSTDSRTVESGSLFIALRGEHFDGHDYLEAALSRGAALVLTDRPVAIPHLQVADTLDAYQTLARWWRQQFDIPVIAVTGSAGKTTTRELIRAVLATAGPVLASTGNENNDIGVPKLLLQLQPEHRFCVVEMGMRGPGEIARLTRCALPTVGVITNVGSAHIGRLGSHEAIAQAKCELLATMGTGIAVLNGADERLLRTARECWSGPIVTYGFSTTGKDDSTHLQFGGVTFEPPLPGHHNHLNFLAALTVAQQLGLELDLVRDRLAPLTLPPGRSRLIELPADLKLVDETYNSAPESARAALDWLVTIPGKRHIAILGQMRELGDHSHELHYQLGSHCRALGLDWLVILHAGEDTDALAAGAKGVPTLYESDYPSLTQKLAALVRPGDRLLFKASRAIGLEKAMHDFQIAVAGKPNLESAE